MKVNSKNSVKKTDIKLSYQAQMLGITLQNSFVQFGVFACCHFVQQIAHQ